jgi:hypothetical protein
MAFTSTGVNLDQSLANSNHGVYTYRIKGQLTHRIGNLLPQHGERPKFCQIFFMDDEDEQADVRQHIFQMPGSRDNFRDLNNILRESSNPYVEVFKQARESQAPNLAIKIAQSTPDPRRYNAPSVSEVHFVSNVKVAALIVDSEEVNQGRDIILTKVQGPLQRISSTHQGYDPLSYPLLFPRGEPGWHSDMRRRSGSHKLSLMDYQKYYLQSRRGGLYFSF